MITLTRALTVSVLIAAGRVSAQTEGCFLLGDDLRDLKASDPACPSETLLAQPNDDEVTRFIRMTVRNETLFWRNHDRWRIFPWSTGLKVCINGSISNAVAHFRPNSAPRIVIGVPLARVLYAMGIGLVGEAKTKQLEAARMVLLAVLAHEFAHQIQFHVLQSQFPVYLESASQRPDIYHAELEADAIAAAYLKVAWKITNLESDAIISTFTLLGDWEFGSPQFHGTPAERRAAAQIGLDAVGASNTISNQTLVNIHTQIFAANPVGPFSAATRGFEALKNEVAGTISDLIEQAGIETNFAYKSVAARFAEISLAGDVSSPDVPAMTQIAGVVNCKPDADFGSAILAIQKAKYEWITANPTSTGTKASEYSRRIRAHLENARRSLRGVQVDTNAPPALGAVRLFAPSTLVVGGSHPEGLGALTVDDILRLSNRGIEGDEMLLGVSRFAGGPPDLLSSAFRLRSGQSIVVTNNSASYLIKVDSVLKGANAAKISAFRLGRF